MGKSKYSIREFKEKYLALRKKFPNISESAIARKLNLCYVSAFGYRKSASLSTKHVYRIQWSDIDRFIGIMNDKEIVKKYNISYGAVTRRRRSLGLLSSPRESVKRTIIALREFWYELMFITPYDFAYKYHVSPHYVRDYAYTHKLFNNHKTTHKIVRRWAEIIKLIFLSKAYDFIATKNHISKERVRKIVENTGNLIRKINEENS